MDEARFQQMMFELMQKDMEANKADFEKELVAFEESWNKEHSTIGAVVRAHLLVEHHLHRFFKTAYPMMGNVRKARISFWKICHLLSYENSIVAFLLPGLLEFNELRNRMAHNLTKDLVEEDIKEIRNFVTEHCHLKIFKVSSPLELIDIYGRIAAGTLMALGISIKRRGQGLGIIGLHRSWEQDIKEKLQSDDLKY